MAFSTAPNGIVLDNPGGKNSLYAKHLIANLNTPGMPIELLLKKARIGVASETQRAQVPWESSSLTADFCFKPDASSSCGGGSLTRLGGNPRRSSASSRRDDD